MGVRGAIFSVLVLIATACTQVDPEDLVIPGTSTPSSSTTVPSTSAPTDSGDSDPARESPGGVIAVGGGADGAVVDASGKIEVATPDGVYFRQPTWSRDGRSAVMIDSGAPGSGRVHVTDALDGDRSISDAARGYFFFSWSPAGDLIAALGPGPEGTSLDILDADGEALSGQTLGAGSFYVAWEPGGDDLLVHRDRTLELVRDPTDLATRESLGEPGQRFLAPAWIPNSRDALVVVDGGAGSRLISLNVDTGEEVDLGPVSGSAGIVVSPDGSRALIAHGVTGAGADIEIAHAAVDRPSADRPVQQVVAPTELVDLASGHRTMVSTEPTFWAEWSPDGARIALMQAATGAVEWVIWEDGATRRLGDFRPAPVFFRDYLFFAWQFVESPRVWSPTGDALVYAALDEENGSAIFVHHLSDDDAERIAAGDVAFWSAE